MRTILAAACVLTLAACSDSPTPPPVAATPPSSTAEAPPASDEAARARIDDYVFAPYTKAEFPKSFAKYGKAMDRAQALREGAARKALDSGRCDRVIGSDLSDRGTAENLTVFVDCENQERFYITEGDLKLATPALTQSERTIDRASAIKACSDAATALATYPSLVDAHTWAGASFNANKTTGNAQVLLDFDAINGFGAELPYRARCIFVPGQQVPEITVAAK